MALPNGQLYHALIRTHHITSRTKVAKLKAAAKKLNCHVLLKSGGWPGLMYVESDIEEDTKGWVDTVHGLRYKDYQLIAPPASAASKVLRFEERGVLREVDAVKDFAAEMEGKGLMQWWRGAMGYDHG